MKHSYLTVAFSTCLALGLSLGSAAKADAATDQAPAPQASTDGQARIAESTAKLEKAFADQFVKGQIDRAALAGPINDVVQAMPEAARPKVQQHIDQVLRDGQKLASELNADQRAQLAAPTTEDKVGKLQWGLVNAWGWPIGYGFGGLGAFAFPGMYYYGAPLYTGYGLGYSSSYGYSTTCGLYGCYSVGYPGWYW